MGRWAQVLQGQHLILGASRCGWLIRGFMTGLLEDVLTTFRTRLLGDENNRNLKELSMVGETVVRLIKTDRDGLVGAQREDRNFTGADSFLQ
jgi:hypothetical protein